MREVASGATQGVYFEKEVYSLFANPLAEPFLKALFATFPEPPELFVYGVATDYCVKGAALGLRERGYATTLITDATAGSPRGHRGRDPRDGGGGREPDDDGQPDRSARVSVTGEKKEYPRPALTADVVALLLDEGGLRVLFIRRGNEPFKGEWALLAASASRPRPWLRPRARAHRGDRRA